MQPPIKNDNGSGLTYNIRTKAQQENRKLEELPKEQKLEVADDILSQAKEQAKKIVEQAKTYSVQYMKATTERINSEYEENQNNIHKQNVSRGFAEGERKGYDAGFKSGYQDGMEKADELSKKNIEFMQSVIEGIDDGRHALLTRYESDLIDVALAIAKNVLKAEIKSNPKAIKSIIEHTAHTCKNRDSLLITVSENSFKLLVSEDCDLTENLAKLSNSVKIVVDDNMEDGDCIIETPAGVIDCGINTQFDNMQATLNEQADAD